MQPIKPIIWLSLSFSNAILISLISSSFSKALSLPPTDDIPEEVLRTEIITEARSPVDGKPLTAAEYAQLQEKLQTSSFPPQLNPELRHLIFLLRLRQFFRGIGLPL